MYEEQTLYAIISFKRLEHTLFNMEYSIHSTTMVRHQAARYRRFILLIGIIVLLSLPKAAAQDHEKAGGISQSWLIMQTVPSVTWTCFPAQTHFAFEWEATPVLYSWGMTKLDPPFHFFFVTQPERFAGSVEFTITTQLYTSKIGTSHWGFSGQLLAHLPVVEYGEYAGLNFGVARYNIAGISSSYVVGGFSTLFGFLHYNIKYSPADKIWMHSIEFRFF
jgi:hypothetical protein